MTDKTRVARSSRASGVHTRGALALYGFGPRALAHALGVDVDKVRSALASGALVPTNLVELAAARRRGLAWLDRLGETQDWVRAFRADIVWDERRVTMLGRERVGEVWAVGYADVAAATGLPVAQVHRHAKSNGYVLRESGELLTMFDVSKFLNRAHGWMYVHREIVRAGAKPMVDDVQELARPIGRPSAKESKRRRSRKATAERVRLIEVHRERARAWLDHWLPKVSDPAPPKLVWTLPGVVQYVEDRLREGLEDGSLPHGPESEKPLRVILGAE